MSVKAIVLSSCALFALGITSAGAGQCTTEIQNMAQLFASSDAGSGPTGQAAGSQHPPTAAMTQADRSTAASSAAAGASKEQHPPTATMNTQTTGSASPGSGAAAGGSAAQGQHPPTTAMNQATAGSAASPQDVQRQTQGAPTASGQAQGAGASLASKSAAMTALDQARALDREGKEAECMAAIRQAHGHMAR